MTKKRPRESKFGPAPKPADLVRGKRIEIQLNEHEIEQIRRAAESSQMPAATFIRKAALDAAMNTAKK